MDFYVTELICNWRTKTNCRSDGLYAGQQH